MERIKTLLDKIDTLNSQAQVEAIDVDLMIDYVKVLYADLLEWKERLRLNEETTLPTSSNGIESYIKEEPSLEEMSKALEEQFSEDGDIDLSPTPLPEETVSILSTNPILQPTNNNPPEPSKLSSIDTQPIPFPQKKEDIRKFIGINEKFVFTNELFQGNREAYEEVLNELIEFSTSEDAIEWLSNTVAEPYDWKEDDFNVQDFYRILESYYKRRKN